MADIIAEIESEQDAEIEPPFFSVGDCHAFIHQIELIEPVCSIEEKSRGIGIE
jgi:hypothetical protein